jgi:hypothetical protein
MFSYTANGYNMLIVSALHYYDLFSFLTCDFVKLNFIAWENTQVPAAAIFATMLQQ